MKQMAAQDPQPKHGPQENSSPCGKSSSEHGHTGEGAASALAHLISQAQAEKRRREAEVDTHNDRHS